MREILQVADDVRALVDDSGNSFADVSWVLHGEWSEVA